MFDPTWLSLYLLMGLGVELGLLYSTNIQWKKDIFGCLGAILAVIVGIVLGLFWITIWPTLMMALFVQKIKK